MRDRRLDEVHAVSWNGELKVASMLDRGVTHIVLPFVGPSQVSLERLQLFLLEHEALRPNAHTAHGSEGCDSVNPRVVLRDVSFRPDAGTIFCGLRSFARYRTDTRIICKAMQFAGDCCTRTHATHLQSLQRALLFAHWFPLPLSPIFSPTPPDDRRKNMP